MQVSNSNHVFSNLNLKVYSDKNMYGECKSVKQLSSDSKYSYCPYCVKRVERGGLDYKVELKPLSLEKWKYAIRINPNDPKDGTAKILWETKLVCDKCKDAFSKPKEITAADFEKVYCLQNNNKVKNDFINIFDEHEMQYF